eukprot:221273_1
MNVITKWNYLLGYIFICIGFCSEYDELRCPIVDIYDEKNSIDYSKYAFFLLLFVAILNIGWILWSSYCGNKDYNAVSPEAFIEYETWYIRKGVENKKHDELMRQWFQFVKKNRSKLFKEWKTVRYYKEVDHDSIATGKYIIMFEFCSKEDHHKYKERRKDYTGPYEEYKKVDPYHLDVFDMDDSKFTEEYWMPQDIDHW